MPVSCCLLHAGLEPFENWSLRPRRSYLQLADGKKSVGFDAVPEMGQCGCLHFPRLLPAAPVSAAVSRANGLVGDSATRHGVA